MVKIKDLKQAAYNPRVMSDKQDAHLIKSIKEFGLVDPVVINKDNTIIGGHQRARAAEAAGLKKIPTVRLDLTKAKEKALNLALNKIHGTWDTSMLTTLLSELKLEVDDIEVTGFDMPEINVLEGMQDMVGENADLTKIAKDFEGSDGKTAKDTKPWVYADFASRKEYDTVIAILGKTIKKPHELDAKLLLKLAKQYAKENT